MGAPVLETITAAFLDLTAGFYRDSAGDVYTYDVNIKSADTKKGFQTKVLAMLRWLSEDIAPTALVALQAKALIFSNITVGTGQSYKCASRSETRTEAVQWSNVAAFSVEQKWLADPGVGGIATAQLHLPDGCTLDELYVYIDPTNGHAAVPGTPPSWVLFEHDLTTNVFTTVATGVDTPTAATGPAYDNIHPVQKTGIGWTINRQTHEYILVFTGESGADSAAGLKLHRGVKRKITRAKVGED